jgi:hypothetical protein
MASPKPSGFLRFASTDRINRYRNTVNKDFLAKLNRRKPQTMGCPG